MEDTRGNTLNSAGSIAIITATLLGPAVVIMPTVIANAGWLPSLFFGVVLCCLGALCGSMLCEAIAAIPGNTGFRNKVELVTAVRFYFGHNQANLAVFLLSVGFILNIVLNVVQSTNVTDALLAQARGETCGLVLNPLSIVCHTNPVMPSIKYCKHLDTKARCLSNVGLGCSWGPASDFGFPTGSVGCYPDSRTLWGRLVPIVFTEGFGIVILICLPLAFGNLLENLIVQYVSLIGTGVIIVIWFAFFIAKIAVEGKEYSFGEHLPTVGSPMGIANLIGIVVYSSGFAHYLPSWVNEKRKDVKINKVVWASAIINTAFTLLCGFGGAAAFGIAFRNDLRSDALEAISYATRRPSPFWKLAVYCVYIYPLIVLIPGIPVACIMLKYNLIYSGVSRPWAFILAVAVPFGLSIPFLSYHSALNDAVSWSSVVVLSAVDFIIPIALYYSFLQWKAHSEVELEATERIHSFVSSPFALLQVTPPRAREEHSDDEKEATQLVPSEPPDFDESPPPLRRTRYGSMILARVECPDTAETHVAIPEKWLTREGAIKLCRWLFLSVGVLAVITFASMVLQALSGPPAMARSTKDHKHHGH